LPQVEVTGNDADNGSDAARSLRNRQRDFDGGVRFSIGAFNTEAEVDAAIAAIADIAKWSRERAAKSRKAVLTAV
jgi:cysteine sulfinate desulfinase/cysteine desulfurase-like protein